MAWSAAQRGLAMTRKKGGGRESGKPSGQSRVEESGGVPAAANPAAHVHRIMNYEEPPYPEDCGPCVAREERIRALEADLAKCRDMYAQYGNENLFDVLKERDALMARVKELLLENDA